MQRMSHEMQYIEFLGKMNFSPDSKWTRIQQLGRGSSGSVFEGCFENGFHFAVKVVSLHDEGSRGTNCVNQLEQEIALWSRFKHQNIVQYYYSYKDELNLYMFMELVPRGSLRSFYQTNPVSCLLVSKYTKDILHGLKYLHDHNVIHRDIKCANILIDAQGSAKLADLGVGKIIRMNDIKSFQGSAFWTAPEVLSAIRHNQGYGISADIWSLGCTVLEMLTCRRVPYQDMTPEQALWRSLNGKLPEIPDFLSVDAQDFIQKCLKINPNDRPTASELLEHPFVLRRPRSGNMPRRGSVLKNIFKKLSKKFCKCFYEYSF
ncbi:putative mitogen-activated protein kinase kinase kinase STE-STE11 family [Rosa chinensis]|uniref:mitogen-activated protein kinase kinase kinase n=1 Tax=Rosa chinensis TaxID=74649 RepID=A0A2P6SGH9_ROSCH|nr:mitogen-activated protein kinase kinase kinase 1 [Rosa chinensis]XP_040367874.1 mitogen-activated protein kinase kinase kinase 1 [Rosa chinensis]XP_040367878.1 mitogen-activated protein kinase kinase kinase 1 [Rosa chinensis]XP_040367881.1 mitogen-activated protein kinase kinase kinase 1 [Rosa chinensis]XP_040367883.1 mitogen-activated protein kinase kinase kinase 1 [Rosa chinensis]PRQ57790.1 putative mitogen-activated protein kinase kinase kinase STE-STE11 family [Rosa chinensis]